MVGSHGILRVVRYALTAYLVFSLNSLALAVDLRNPDVGGSLQRVEKRYADALGSASQYAPLSGYRFEALGRSFDVQLLSNADILGRIPASQIPRNIEIYKGELTGIPGSWARLTIRNNRVDGLIFDGSELFQIESRVLPNSKTGAEAEYSAHMYRVKDVNRLFRDLVIVPDIEHEVNLDKSNPPVFEKIADKSADISVVMDPRFINENADPMFDVITAINLADGIFAKEVGVQLTLGFIESFTFANTPFSGNDPSIVLGQLGQYRRDNPDHRSATATYLFTGVNFDDIIGVAYISGLCHVEFGSGIVAEGGWLTLSHELGHNYGAPHDGEEGSPCAHVSPTNYLMGSASEGENFSDCSLQQMAPIVANANCFNPVAPGEIVLLPVDAPDSELYGREFDVRIEVQNIGSVSSIGTTVDIDLGGDFELTAEPYTRGYPWCTVSGAMIQCVFEHIEAGLGVAIDLKLKAVAAGDLSIPVSMTAINDADMSNNNAEIQISITPAIDLETKSVLEDYNAYPDEIVMIPVAVTNLAPFEATETELDIGAYPDIEILDVVIDKGSCAQDLSGDFECILGTLLPEEIINLTVTSKAVVEFHHPFEWGYVRVHSFADEPDGVSGNNGHFTDFVIANAYFDATVIGDPDSGTIEVDDPGSVSFVLTNHGPDPIPTMTAELHLNPVASSERLEVLDISADKGTCVQVDWGSDDGSKGVCTIDNLAVGDNLIMTATFQGKRTGTTQMRFRADFRDGKRLNTFWNRGSNLFLSNRLEMVGHVSVVPKSEPPPAPTGGGGGGGGQIGWLSLMLLLLGLITTPKNANAFSRQFRKIG